MGDGSTRLLELRLFTVSEAARLLPLSPSTLSYWLHGSERSGRVYDPVLRESLNGEGTLTWGSSSKPVSSSNSAIGRSSLMTSAASRAQLTSPSAGTTRWPDTTSTRAPHAR